MVNQRKKDLVSLSFFIAALILLNLLTSQVFTRIDFTADKRYTLSPITKNILNKLNEPLQITVYLEGDFPAGFKRLRNSTEDLLRDFDSYAGKNLQFDFVVPLSGDQQSQEEAYQRLLEMGIEPTQLSVKTENGMSQKLIYPVALITYKGLQTPVKLLQTKSGISPEEVLNNSIQNLEYAFASAIKKLSTGGSIRIGFTEGHGELNDLQLHDAVQSLSDSYEVGRVDLKSISFEGLDKLKVLVVAKPETSFSEAEKYKIDYFVRNGGSIIWSIDQVSAELDSLRGSAEQLAFPKKLGLDDMFFKYGVRLNYDLIADMNAAQIPLNVGELGGQSQIQLLPWLFYPILVPVSTHPIVKNLDGIKTEFPSSIDLISVENVRAEVILASSPFSRSLKTPAMLSLQMVEEEPDPAQFQSAPMPVGVLLEGQFPSNFKNRPIPEGISSYDKLPAKAKHAKMMVLADGDFFKNQINKNDGSPYPLGFDRFNPNQQFANKSFLLNTVDYLVDDSGIIGLRNKEIKLRLLDRAKIKQEKTFWQLINIILPLFVIFLAGIFQHYYRIGKYTR
jgi:ABC-2 type transport system permease protein